MISLAINYTNLTKITDIEKNNIPIKFQYYVSNIMHSSYYV